MSDDQKQLPDTLDGMMQSGIIQKLVAILVPVICTFIYSICSLFGLVVTPDLAAKISAAVLSFLVLVLVIWTIHNRLTKPCPPIVPKSTQTTEKTP